MGPVNVLAFYRAGDSVGKRIAEYYASARGLPAVNVLAVNINWVESDGIYILFDDFDSLCSQLNAACADKDIMCLLSCGCFPMNVGYGTLNRDNGWGFHELLENLGLFEQYSVSVICDTGLADPHKTYDTIHPFYGEDYPPDYAVGDPNAASYFAGRSVFLFNGKSYRNLPQKDADYGIGGLPKWTRQAAGNPWIRMPKNRREYLKGREQDGYLGTDAEGTNMTYAHIRLECCPIGENNPHYTDEFDVIKRVIDDSIAAEAENRTTWGNTLLAGGVTLAYAYHVYNELVDNGKSVDNIYWVDMNVDAVESTPFYGSSADNMPNGESAIVPGVGFSENPLPDVFFTVLGAQAYYTGNGQKPLNVGQMDFSKGSIYVAGQSFGMVPAPYQDTDWHYSLANFPVDFGTTFYSTVNGDSRDALDTDVYFWHSNAFGQTTGRTDGEVGTIRIRRNTTAPPATATIRMSADNVFEFSEDAGVVGTVDVNGMTIDAAFDYLIANMPTNWEVRPVSGGTMSRCMSALLAGASVVIGATREPTSAAYISAKHMVYHFLISGDCLAEASMKWNPPNGVGGEHGIGYNQNAGRGIIGDPLYRPFHYIHE